MVAISIRPLSAEDAREFLAVVLDSEQELLPWVDFCSMLMHRQGFGWVWEANARGQRSTKG